MEERGILKSIIRAQSSWDNSPAKRVHTVNNNYSYGNTHRPLFPISYKWIRIISWELVLQKKKKEKIVSSLLSSTFAETNANVTTSSPSGLNLTATSPQYTSVKTQGIRWQIRFDRGDQVLSLEGNVGDEEAIVTNQDGVTFRDDVKYLMEHLGLQF